MLYQMQTRKITDFIFSRFVAAVAAASNSKHHHGGHGPVNGGPGGFEFQRISIDRSKMSEEEAFEHAIEMIQTRQMGFRKAADFFSVIEIVLNRIENKNEIENENHICFECLPIRFKKLRKM